MEKQREAMAKLRMEYADLEQELLRKRKECGKLRNGKSKGKK